MKIRTIFTLCILFKIGLSYSQNKISGKIVDNLKEPLPFANIILYQSEDKKVITGTTSDFDGNYRFKNILDSNYYVEVSSLGFKTQRKEPFLLSKKDKSRELNFVLEEEAQTLDEIIIKSRRPTIRQTGEKLIVDLERSEMSNTNLQSVMKKVPGIIVINGNISYGGQQGVRILINGKTTDY